MLSVSFGTVIWTTIAFLLVLFLLGKFAWPSILKSIKDREENITNALKSAEKAREEMKALHADNEKLLAEARAERDEMMKSAREAKENILRDAKEQSRKEGDAIIRSAKETIKNEKAAAIAELKKTVADLSVEIAGKILKTELSDKQKQQELISDALQNSKLN